MVNHYLLTLTPDQEHRVLTRPMYPGLYHDPRGACLVGTALGQNIEVITDYVFRIQAMSPYCCAVERRYDGLCKRFTTSRTNRVIRDRVLANVARRTLQRDAVPAMEAV